MPTHHLYLVPGFFGFANLGQITYFGHVRRILAEKLPALGLDARLHVVRVHPTASLPRRAAQLAGSIAASARGRDAVVHLVGHSSGGLDARLLASPGCVLPGRNDAERIARRVRTVVTVATPHHGTPLASFFATLRGQRLLQLVSLATIHLLRFGHLPLSAVLALGAFLARLDDLAVNSDLLDEVFERLLGDFTPGRRRSVGALLDEVVRDQALLLQLTPEAMEVFDASVGPRPGVRYACVVTQAARPRLRSRLAAGLDPAAQLSRTVFGALHGLAAETSRRHAPLLEPAQARTLRKAYHTLPAPSANDGIVPTRSQVSGRVLHAAVADHLDVLGHFRADDASPHVDWLFSGSRFDRRQFEALWSDVARFIAGGGR
jgi:triacylglycerol esterase/lipase EstA (alpha/beta hydrolase family)